MLPNQDEINRLKTNIASTEKQEKNLNIQLQNRLKTTKQLYNVIPPVTPAVTTANTTPATSASSADRGRGVSITGLPSLRTVRAVFPHTVLQKTGISFKRLDYSLWALTNEKNPQLSKMVLG